MDKQDPIDVKAYWPYIKRISKRMTLIEHVKEARLAIELLKPGIKFDLTKNRINYLLSEIEKRIKETP
tara:strand:- start:2137 stop:2340 length:204 start_codon:yes stop_codon:yes gene_type:complete